MTKTTLKRSLVYAFTLTLLVSIQSQALGACKVDCHNGNEEKPFPQAPRQFYYEISGVQAEELTSLLIRAKLLGEGSLFVAYDIEVREKVSEGGQFFALRFKDHYGAFHLSQEGEILWEIASSLNIPMSKNSVGEKVFLKISKISCLLDVGHCVLMQTRLY
jgi:hypothetical protein